MKSVFAILILACLCFLPASAFDWKPKPNQELRADMIHYIESAEKESKDAKLNAELNAFVRRLEKEQADSYTWMKETHELVRTLSRQYPAEPRFAKQREIILRIFDYPLHFDDRNPQTPAEGVEEFQSVTIRYFTQACAALLRQVKETTPKPGSVAIWNVYNMGYIIKGPKHTMAIDIANRPAYYKTETVDGRKVVKSVREAWPEADLAQLAELLDVIFVTHMHGDHHHARLLQKMAEAGKAVVLPTKTRLFGAELPKNVFILDQAVAEPRDIAGIKVLSFPGNQGKNTPCNVYLLDVDGIRLVHTGDNYDRAEEARIKNYEAPNLIIGATWNSIQHLIRCAAEAKGASKANQVVLPSHNNELGHRPQQRESYWELYTHSARMGNPDFTYPSYLDLGWCEGFFYPEMKGIPVPK